MAIDTISLLAQNSYNRIQDQPKNNIEATEIHGATKFHDIVDKQFNSFAKMSSAQILNHIQKNQQVTETHRDSGSKGQGIGFVSSLRSSLHKQEEVTRKSLINEASLLDVLTATTEAKNNLEVMVKTRDKFMEAFDKVMNMSI